jgi:hypothetical protein
LQKTIGIKVLQHLPKGKVKLRKKCIMASKVGNKTAIKWSSKQKGRNKTWIAPNERAKMKSPKWKVQNK